MSCDLNASGQRLFSLGYVGGDKSWAILGIGLRRLPTWTDAKNVFCLYREICYLNETGEVEGLGRSWIPLRWANWSLIRKCYRPFRPLPLGVALKKIWGASIDIHIRNAEFKEGALARYREANDNAICFKRIFTRTESSNNIIIATEEDLLTHLVNV